MSAGTPLWAWVLLLVLVVGMLGFDLVRHRDAHVISFREATRWTVFWIFCGLAFGLFVYAMDGFGGGDNPADHGAIEYYTGFLLEYSLSVDNIFVFVLIFSYFKVPSEYQHRVLFWGVFGAIIFRGIFIFVGAALLEQFHWMIFIFGAFLVFTGIRMAFHKDEDTHPDRNPVIKLLYKVMPISKGYEGQHFLTRVDGKLVGTLLLVVLVVIETTDIVFAVDSVPAILAITTDTFIVFAATAFAILGLRSLYFVLAGMMRRFVYLQIGLSVLLVFIGGKMLFQGFTDNKLPIWLSLGVIILILAVSVTASLIKTKGVAREELPGG